jgi:phage gp16-like protein
MSAAVNDTRRRELAKIHLAAKALGLDAADKDPNSDYRSMLWAVARVRSAADLDEAGRRRVLDHLKACGFKAQRTERSFGMPHNLASSERGPQLKKIEAMLTAAARPWAYADGMAKRMFHVERVAFCNPAQLQGIIAALVKDAQRHNRRTQ